MRAFRTVVLHHAAPGHPHHDWLMEVPHDPGGALFAARVALAPAAWPAAGHLHLEPLPPHRRAWLSREGPVSGGRGRARRVAAGAFTCGLWTPHRIELELRLGPVAGHLRLTRAGTVWEAVLTSPEEGRQ